MKNSEKVREIARKYRGTMTDAQYHSMFNAIFEMSKWKDEQHEQSIIDLNCKLEEQQANYEELKKRYDEAVEREKIATKIINELRQRK